MDAKDKQAGASGILLVSDVDDTLTGDASALEAFARVARANRPGLRIVLNSSRPYESVQHTIRHAFPAGFTPDGIITAMGTQMRVSGEPVDRWRQRFAGWPRTNILRIVTALGHEAHDDEFQTEFKASFAVRGREAQEQVARALQEAGLPCRIINSGVSDMDILPPGGGKDHATRYITEHLGIAPENLIVAGDSANDLAMFQVAPRCIAVGNARDELLDAAPAERTYHARAHHAGGVLEGLRYYGALKTDHT